MGFSNRRVLRQELRIFNTSGTTMALLLRNTPPSGTYTPGVLFTQDEDPPETIGVSGNYTKIYVKGKFYEENSEYFGSMGRERSVSGIISIPMLYRASLAAAEYVDPFLDGSRFIKVGSIVDEGRIFISQKVKSLVNTSVADVVYKGNGVDA